MANLSFAEYTLIKKPFWKPCYSQTSYISVPSLQMMHVSEGGEVSKPFLCFFSPLLFLQVPTKLLP